MTFLLNLRSTLAYQTNGSTISSGSIFTTVGSVPTWSNQLTYSTLTGSSIATQSVSTNSLALASTITGSSIILSGNVLNSGTSNLTIGTQSTGLLILNSQGGALALQSGGMTIASVSNTAGVTMSNGYQLWFNNSTGGQSNIRTNGAGSMYLQVNSTASSIYFSTENAATVFGFIGANGISSNAIYPYTSGADFQIGQLTSGWTTIYTKNLQTQPYPSASYGSQGAVSIGWSFANVGEVSFMNNFGNSGGFPGGFQFYNRTDSTTSTLLATINASGISSSGTISSSIGAGNNALLANSGGRVALGSPNNSNAWYLANDSSNRLQITNSGAGGTVTIDSTGLTVNTGNISTPATCSIYSGGGGNINFIASNSGVIGFYNNSSGLVHIANMNSGGLEFFNGKGITLNNAGNANAWYCFNGGSTINAYSLQQGGGNLYELRYLNSTGVFTVPSDRNKKKNIEPIESILDKYVQLKPSYYHYKLQEDETVDKNIGLIAQDVVQLFNNKTIVSQNDEGVYSLDYGNFTILTIKAVQEQHALVVAQATQIESQQTRISSLELQLASASTEITSLQTQLSQVLQRLSAAGIA